MKTVAKSSKPAQLMSLALDRAFSDRKHLQNYTRVGTMHLPRKWHRIDRKTGQRFSLSRGKRAGMRREGAVQQSRNGRIAEFPATPRTIFSGQKTFFCQIASSESMACEEKSGQLSGFHQCVLLWIEAPARQGNPLSMNEHFLTPIPTKSYSIRPGVTNFPRSAFDDSIPWNAAAPTVRNPRQRSPMEGTDGRSPPSPKALWASAPWRWLGSPAYER
jgi:hypothetical protein